MISVQNKLIPVVGTLLESLEKAGIQIESQCRMGYCGACRTKLMKGEVEYIDEPLGFVMPGEILACCCKPKNNFDIEVSIKTHS